MKLAAIAVVLGLACSSKPAAEKPSGPAEAGVAAYTLGSGRFEASGSFRTAGAEIPWSIEIERSCAERGGQTKCLTRFTRTAGSESTWYESRTALRPTGEHEIHFKDADGERNHDALIIPAPDRLPLEWKRPGAEGFDAACAATRDEGACEGGMRIQCETERDGSLVIVDARIICPDRGETLRRRVGTYSPLCEQLIDVPYERWQGADAAAAELTTRPRRCERTSPLGWTRQTPNRDWSVALPGRGRMVLGPDKHTVNLHVGPMSYIAYEGTGANATVQSDADVPAMVAEFDRTVGTMLGLKAGEPKRRDGPHPDWTVPLLGKDGEPVGALRLIARDGVMYSLTTHGPDKELGASFIESFQIHEAGFGAAAAAELDRYIAAGEKYRDQVCACATIECARAIPELTAPTRGFPSAEQEQQLGALAAAIEGCAQKLASPAP